VQHTVLMRALERAGDLTREPHGIVDRHRTAQRLPVDELHHQVVGTDVVQRADVWMVQRGDRPRFLLERIVRALQGLDGDDPVEAGMARFPDFAHASSAQGGQDFVRADDAAGVQGHGKVNKL
jgi:hypothetical protein